MESKKCPACKLNGIDSDMIVLHETTRNGYPWTWYRCDKHTYPFFTSDPPRYKPIYKQTKLF